MVNSILDNVLCMDSLTVVFGKTTITVHSVNASKLDQFRRISVSVELCSGPVISCSVKHEASFAMETFAPWYFNRKDNVLVFTVVFFVCLLRKKEKFSVSRICQTNRVVNKTPVKFIMNIIVILHEVLGIKIQLSLIKKVNNIITVIMVFRKPYFAVKN